ncbi:protein Shroom1-like [Sinocyclocheilus anshuiensis]|uniref:protein Shroom1-like n=1 Tax=Sinocyclocheilus anshuiensis TaxID=1608454 RepID=UPI0007BA8391|nr:PREDICTED: protein Shroom1-like [Sinocyclocheilus anshuiensis]XP_016306910.1 PREDICTED: protein Shroom1-like [Sinocyclocheilus anshuiensis]
MDSYHFHFERMSNLDLYPLSLPVSRLAPAKSSNSIDQYNHHHSKGDSAYSSFSGGSNVPDYPSPFVLDELQSQNLHYKGMYSPIFLDSDSKSMDHLYRSMETVAQEHHWSSGGFSDIEDPPVHTHPLPPPPPPPARLNSFVTTRNLENSRSRQSPEGQLADLSTSQQTSNSEVCGVRAEPVYGRTFSQLKDHLKQDQVNKMLDPPKSTGILNRFPQQTCQPEHLLQPSSSQSETQRKRSHSAYGGPVSEHQCFVSSCNMPQNMISGSIQHKGQFYFVTGVFKSSEPSVVQGVGDSASVETSSEWSYKTQRRRQSCPDGPSGRLFFQEEHKFSIQNEVVEHPNDKALHSSFKSEQTSEGVEDQRVMSRETGRHHSTSHPIFYCGPEDNSVGTTMTPAQIKQDHTSHPKKEEPMTRALRRPQLDIPSDKISKEATPLLYHLTGANRVSYTDKFKNNNDCNIEVKNPDCVKDKQKSGNDEQASPSSEYRQSEMSKEKQPNEFFYPCGTLDDSYKKYYKEKLKDAQSKVLRETSFKRRDLQLSQPHRIKQQTDKKLSVEPSLQDKLPNLEATPVPQLHNPQEYSKDLGQEIEKAIEKEPEKPQNIAQPQVPRVGSRKRLTADQKKLSHSEPEKLHQLADGPAHMTCHSLGNEAAEGLLSEGDHSLVAARRKMFETRGRALSASNFSRSTLKHLQHKALVAYMERKTGQKVAEPQHPVPQVPSHRNSTSESSRHNSGLSDSKKLHRPLSAGQILDSVSSSVKYSQFITAKHSRQSSWREESSTAGKSASVESLLDQLEQPKFFRTRSTSNPHAFQVRKHPDESSAIHNKAISSVQRKVEEDTVVHHSHTASVPDERHVQVRASRGKSMEELDVSRVTRPEFLSKSSEQLDQVQGRQVIPGTERRTLSFLAEGRRTQRRIPSSGEHMDNSQAGPENPLLTHFVKHVSSYDDDIHTASHNGRKNKEDMALSMPSHSRLEVSKQQDVCPQDKSETSLSSQEVSLGHGVTTDPSLWISASVINETEANYWPSTETATIAEPQSAPRSPSDENKTTSITTPPGNQETCLVTALNREQDGNVKKEDGPVVMEGSCPADKLEWEVLVRDVVLADQSLARILYPVTNRKTALMLMEQLLSEDTLLMEEHYKKKQEQKINNPEKAANSTEMPVGEKPLNLPSSVNNQSVLSNQKDVLSNTDIIDKKRRLIAHIEEHLQCLEEVRSTVQSEEKVNGERGDALEALVRESCVSAELERYTQFIEDLERVVSLLLCLSARLARVQNALSTADDSMDAEERQSLDSRYRLLCKQREDAKDLKDNLDRRERVVSTFLSKQLTDTQLQEYRRFIQTKASLLIRQKDLDEKQRLGEEQLEALLCSLPPSDSCTWLCNT